MAVALYCYLVPLFRPLSLAPAFLIFLSITLTVEPGFFRAIYAGAALALILGIKDFVIVNRKAAYQLLVFLISFAGCLMLFGSFAAWSASAVFLYLAALCLLWLWLLTSAPERPVQDRSPANAAVAALLLFEIGAVIFFLPIGLFAQAALLFFASALLFEAATNLRSMTLKQASIWGGSYAAISLLVVFLASWKV